MLTKRHRDHRTKRGSGSVHLRRFAIAALALGGQPRRRGMRRRRRDRERWQQRERADGQVDGQAQRRPDDLELAPLHRQAAPSRTSRRRPASRSSTSRTSTTTPSSSARCSRCWPRASRAGAAIFVVTDWMANKMHELGYLQNLDKSAIPNVEKNLSRRSQHPTFDPNRDFSVPWQSGMTGLDRPHGPGARRARRSTTSSTPSTRARSRCSPRCATRCRW